MTISHIFMLFPHLKPKLCHQLQHCTAGEKNILFGCSGRNTAIWEFGHTFGENSNRYWSTWVLIFLDHFNKFIVVNLAVSVIHGGDHLVNHLRHLWINVYNANAMPRYPSIRRPKEDGIAGGETVLCNLEVHGINITWFDSLYKSSHNLTWNSSDISVRILADKEVAWWRIPTCQTMLYKKHVSKGRIWWSNMNIGIIKSCQAVWNYRYIRLG